MDKSRKLIILGYEDALISQGEPVKGMAERLFNYRDLGWMSAIATNTPTSSELGLTITGIRESLKLFFSLEFAIICPTDSGNFAYLVSSKSISNICDFGICKEQDWVFNKPNPGMFLFAKSWLCADQVVVVGSHEDELTAINAEFEFCPVDLFLDKDFLLP